MRFFNTVPAVSALVLFASACSGGSAESTTTSTLPPPSTAGTVSTTLPASTTAAPTTIPPPPAPPPVLGRAWPDSPLLDVAAARDGDLMIAGPQGVLLVRDGASLGLLYDRATRAVAPDGIGGIACQTPFRLEDSGNHSLWWLPGTGGREHVGLGGIGTEPGSPLGYFRLQEVDWVPRLGRYEDGAWIPTYTGLTAFFADSELKAVGVLLTTGNPLWPAPHFGITLPGAGGKAAAAWTGRHLVETAASAEGVRLEFRRIDGTLDAVAHNPIPEFGPGWIGNVDAEPGPSLLAFTLAPSPAPFGEPTQLRVVDLLDGREALAVEIGGPDERVVRLDLHDGSLAVSTVLRSPGGLSLDLVRLVDLATGRVTVLPWGGTASFFHWDEALPAATYPAVRSEMPELVVTAPIEAAVVDESTVRFEGYTTPGAEVTAAGRYPVPVAADGRWFTTLSLNPGGNVVVFAAAFPGGPIAETARVVFRVAGPEMGYSLDLRYESGDEPTWVATVWVYDRITARRLPGVAVTLSLVDSRPEPPPVQLVTDGLGRVVYRTPITGGTALACIMGLQVAGYPSPPGATDDATLPPGAIACTFADYP